MPEKENQGREIWELIEKAVFSVHGCLLPPGEVSIQLVMPWTKEKYLGELKRKGKIISWVLDKGYADGNLRRYLITLTTEKI